MKIRSILLYSLFFSLIISTVTAQNLQSLSTSEAFASLANDTEFTAIHSLHAESPKQLSVGEEVIFETPDGRDASARLFKARVESMYYLFLYHESWGINAHILEEAQKFSEVMPGVNVLVVDLYDGKVAKNREEATAFMESRDESRLKAIVEGASEYAGKRSKIISMGWGFGGKWSLQTALMLGRRMSGCVVYYGMPEKDPKVLKGLKTDVLGIFATEDKWITPEMVADFEESMQQAGKDVRIEMFDADHAFGNPSGDAYDEAAATEAKKVTMMYLQRKFNRR